MNAWRWINQWKSGAGCLWSWGVWKIHVYFGVEWQWTRAQRASETGDITSELLPPQWKPLTKARLHLQTLMPLPSEGTHRAEPGSPPSSGRVGGGLGLVPAKTQPQLRTHSCSYLTRQLDGAQQLRSYTLWRLKPLRPMLCGVNLLP